MPGAPRRISTLLAALAALAAAAAPSGAHALEAKIARTKYGVPHITASSVQSMAAGYAYAFAEDNICTIANEYVTVAAERSPETVTYSFAIVQMLSSANA